MCVIVIAIVTDIVVLVCYIVTVCYIVIIMHVCMVFIAIKKYRRVYACSSLVFVWLVLRCVPS